MSRRTLLGLALLAAAVVTSWTAWRNCDRDQAPPAPEQRSDYVLRDFELVMLARDGSESLRLTAPELKRRREDESADIVQPVFVMPASQGSWRLDADTGWIAADGDLVRLEGNVAADSQGDNPSQASLRTDRLELLPAQDQARTDARVTLTQPGIIQTGVGMDADLKNRTYRIKSQVKVRYDTQKR